MKHVCVCSANIQRQTVYRLLIQRRRRHELFMSSMWKGSLCAELPTLPAFHRCSCMVITEGPISHGWNIWRESALVLIRLAQLKGGRRDPRDIKLRHEALSLLAGCSSTKADYCAHSSCEAVGKTDWGWRDWSDRTCVITRYYSIVN